MPTQVSAEHRARLRTALKATGADLLRYFERRTWSTDDAADLLGETMLQAWRRVEKLPESAEAQRMWLFTVAAHTLANHRRSTKRRRALTERLREELGQTDEVADSGASLEVRDAVLRLHRAHRELVMLIHWDGFTIVEAAELLGVNPSTARSRYAAAREALKSALRDQVHC